MKVHEQRQAVHDAVRQAQRAGKRVGLVPTMGALHAGHLSLVDAAVAECDVVVASIFVNPTQFAPNEDLEKYPRPLSRDLELLEAHGCHAAFTPAAEEIYPNGFATTIHAQGVAEPLEGAARPGHFDGVATIVLKLFNLIPADKAYFGEKDYQQTLVIKQMIRDLNLSITMRVCPIVRETGGLAMSSRNAYLSKSERQQALSLSKSLQAATLAYEQGERDGRKLRDAMQQILDDAKVETEYVALVRDGTIEPVTQIDGPTRVLIAARVGKTRLIDNQLMAVGDQLSAIG